MLEYTEISSMSLSEGCWYCEGEANTWDHIIPRKRRGSNNIENLVPCCNKCNSTKGAKPLFKFRQYLASKGLSNDFDTPEPKVISGFLSSDNIFRSLDGSLEIDFFEFVNRKHFY